MNEQTYSSGGLRDSLFDLDQERWDVLISLWKLQGESAPSRRVSRGCRFRSYISRSEDIFRFLFHILLSIKTFPGSFWHGFAQDFGLLKVSFITYYMSLFRSCVEMVFAAFVLLFTFDFLRLKRCFVDGKQIFLPTVTKDTTPLIYYWGR